MISASRSVFRARDAAEPLPHIPELADLYQFGCNPRRGQLMMIVGRPGSQKSGLALWLCDQWNLPTLYWAADMGQTVTIARLAGMRNNMSSEEVTVAFHDGGAPAAYLEDALTESKIQFCYEDAPTLDDIEGELSAWAELYDEYPAIMVIDNLMDLDGDGDDEYRIWRQNLLWLKGLVRTTGITVIVVHHARELTESDFPAPSRDIAGKVTQSVELALSVSLSEDRYFRLCPVKNRTGRQDASAKRGIELLASPAKSTFAKRGTYIAPEKKRGGFGG